MKSIHVVARTHPGLHRKNNEDRFAVSSDMSGTFWAIVCDGMGGHSSGEVASDAAIETWTDEMARCGEMILDTTAVSGALARANARILARSKNEQHLKGMGTTAVVLAIDPAISRCIIAHAGDSRIYRYNGTRLDLLTRDHNIAREVEEEGSMELASQLKPTIARQLTRHLGMDDFPGPEIAVDSVADGDLFLLCTDGLHSVLADSMLIQYLCSRNLDAIADDLIAATLKAGAPDNVTFVIARVYGGQ